MVKCRSSRQTPPTPRPSCAQDRISPRPHLCSCLLTDCLVLAREAQKTKECPCWLTEDILSRTSVPLVQGRSEGSTYCQHLASLSYVVRTRSWVGPWEGKQTASLELEPASHDGIKGKVLMSPQAWQPASEPTPESNLATSSRRHSAYLTS